MPPIMATLPPKASRTLCRLGDVAADAGRRRAFPRRRSRSRRSGRGCASCRRRCDRSRDGRRRAGRRGSAGRRAGRTRGAAWARSPCRCRPRRRSRSGRTSRPRSDSSMNRSFLSSRALQQAMDPIGVVEASRGSAALSAIRQQACCQQPAWSPQTKPRRMPASPMRSYSAAIAFLSSLGHRHVLLDQLDVLVPLDEVLGDPGGRAVAAGLVGQLAAGRGDGVMERACRPGRP